MTGEDMSMYLLAILIAVVTIVIYILYQRKKLVRRDVLLMGLCDSGKTLIYSQLLHSKYIDTHTSIKENVGEFLVNKKSLRIVDIPGHERLRSKFFDNYKNTAKGIIYVVDSHTIQKDVRDVAEFLYVILTDQTMMSTAPQIMILCNKQDELLAKGSAVVKSLLEKEMNTLRITQSSQLESVDPSKTKKVYLGKEDKDFDFSSVPPFNIEFEESQACADKTKIDVVKKWLCKIA